VTAISLYGAIVTDLYRRERTGKGCNVSTSLIANGAWATSIWLQAGLFGAKFSGEVDRKNPPNALVGATYRTSDNRWLVVCFIEEDKNWPVFAKAIGRADLLDDPRFADSKSRHVNSAALVAELDQEFGEKTLAEWKALLGAARLPYGVVQIPEEIVKDPQLFANRLVVPINDGNANPKYTVDSPVVVREAPKVAPRVAPGLGEHTAEVLAELGFNPSQIDGLRASGAIPKAQQTAAGGAA
jgi:crotonobetainyl-CoA:carnitine CoA-transferase CaiB-like acyl-CoA transferase